MFLLFLRCYGRGVQPVGYGFGQPIRHLLLFLLAGVPRAFDVDKFVFLRARHMTVQILEVAHGITVGEVVVGADEEHARVRNVLRDGEVPVLRRMCDVEYGRECPVMRRVRDTLYPSHEGEGQHLTASAARDLCADGILLVRCDTAHHVG